MAYSGFVLLARCSPPGLAKTNVPAASSCTAAGQLLVVRSKLSKRFDYGTLRFRQMDFALVPRHRGHADQLLRAVEQPRELLAGRLEGELLQPFRSGAGAAHYIDALLEAVDAVETVLFLANVEYSPCRLQQAQGRAHARLGLSGTVRAGGQLYGKVSGR